MTFTLARIAAAVLLVIALGPQPYAYYTFLRWVVCGVCAFGAGQANASEKAGWPFALGVVAVVFNPVVPIELTRGLWVPIDVVATVVILASIPYVKWPQPVGERREQHMERVREMFGRELTEQGPKDSQGCGLYVTAVVRHLEVGTLGQVTKVDEDRGTVQVEWENGGKETLVASLVEWEDFNDVEWERYLRRRRSEGSARMQALRSKRAAMLSKSTEVLPYKGTDWHGK